MSKFNITPERRLRWLKQAWDRTKGEAWEPPDPRHQLIEDAITAGYIRRVDGRCGFELMKDAMVTWTQAGRVAMEASA